MAVLQLSGKTCWMYIILNMSRMILSIEECRCFSIEFVILSVPGLVSVVAARQESSSLRENGSLNESSCLV